MLKKKPKKSLETLIGNLARSTKEGFIASDKKLEDLARSTKEGFDSIDRRFDVVEKNFEIQTKLFIEKFHLVDEDIKYLKRAVSPLMNVLGNQDRTILKLEDRISRVERKVGLVK